MNARRFTFNNILKIVIGLPPAFILLPTAIMITTQSYDESGRIYIWAAIAYLVLGIILSIIFGTKVKRMAAVGDIQQATLTAKKLVRTSLP